MGGKDRSMPGARGAASACADSGAVWCPLDRIGFGAMAGCGDNNISPTGGTFDLQSAFARVALDVLPARQTCKLELARHFWLHHFTA